MSNLGLSRWSSDIMLGFACICANFVDIEVMAAMSQWAIAVVI